MLKFNVWPPTPGEVELIIPLEHLRGVDTPARTHYQTMGRLVSSLLSSNMEESRNKLGDIQQIAHEISRSPIFAYADMERQDLVKQFMIGVGMEAMAATSERGAHV